MPAFYSIALLVGFYALLVAEFLIPSGGILGITAAIVALTSILIALTHSVSLALGITATIGITTPLLFLLGIRFWPSTRIGRMMLNRDDLQRPDETPPPTTLDGVHLSELVGRVGIAKTHLLPSGQIVVDGHKTDALSTGLPIDAGTPILVVAMRSGKLSVRAATEQECQQDAKKTLPDTPPIAEVSGSTILDEVDLDEFAS